MPFYAARWPRKLARKRPSPLLKGKPNAWASGIVRAVGAVNFLHDQSQTPYMRATDIGPNSWNERNQRCCEVVRDSQDAKALPVRSELVAAKSSGRQPDGLELEYNGIMMDMRMAPRELQELASTKA